MEEFCELCEEELSGEYFGTECCGDVCSPCFDGAYNHAHYVCDECDNGVRLGYECSQGCNDEEEDEEEEW